MNEADRHTQEGRFTDTLRQRAAAELRLRKNLAFEGLGTVARAMRDSTAQLRDRNHVLFADYVEDAASRLDRVASELQNKELKELVEDVERFARRQPALFVASAFALGVLGARFVKSSSSHAHNE